MRTVVTIVVMWLAGGGVVFSGLIGSYVARISWSDHRSSRGVMLRDTDGRRVCCVNRCRGEGIPTYIH